MLSHNNLAMYYKTIFIMAQHHKYSIDTLESMLPYERDVYTEMLAEYIEKQRRETDG
jgi:hypothetical protein